MKKILIFTTSLLLLIVYYTLNLSLPTTQEIKLPPLTSNESILLVPLDSRPVCSTMVQKLAHLAGIEVVLPPKPLLDDYQNPADTEKLQKWVQDNVKNYHQSIISADILLHGSLLNSRQSTVTKIEQKNLLNTFAKFNSANNNVDIFSIIPRLLVSDDLYPDRWYQFHLMRYSQLVDMVEINNDFYFTQKLQEYQNKIPDNIIKKYQLLFSNSQIFNKNLLQTLKQQNNLKIIIGQDDASPFGFPHRNATELEKIIKHENLQKQAFFTYGADEIAALLLTKYYLKQCNYQPKIYLKYAQKNTEFTHMPYMAVSTGAALRNQIQLLGAQLVESQEKADIVFYVNCGDAENLPQNKNIYEISHLLQENIPVALIDLSANFTAQEMLLPHLLQNNIPINKLVAYAGWNTFSNSSGTALAQALIFNCRLQQLKAQKASSKEIVALYAENLKFTTERILEDYYYQKKIHPLLRPKLESFGVTPTNLGYVDKQNTEAEIQAKISLYALYLLHNNLGRTPFFTINNTEYYLHDLTVASKLPWNRIFEVNLTLYTKIGEKKSE